MTAIPVHFDDKLKAEYRQLYSTAKINPMFERGIKLAIQRLVAHKPAYEAVAQAIKCPWFFIACVHNRESNGSFLRHFFNGDPLFARTVHEPKGYPLEGEPPFTWEQSALAALRKQGIDKWSDWTLSGLLWQMERYNGLAYRQYHPTVPSPYLWSMTNKYTSGKYVADGKFSPTAIDAQIGCVALLKTMEADKIITIAGE